MSFYQSPNILRRVPKLLHEAGSAPCCSTIPHQPHHFFWNPALQMLANVLVPSAWHALLPQVFTWLILQQLASIRRPSWMLQLWAGSIYDTASSASSYLAPTMLHSTYLQGSWPTSSISQGVGLGELSAVYGCILSAHRSAWHIVLDKQIWNESIHGWQPKWICGGPFYKWEETIQGGREVWGKQGCRWCPAGAPGAFCLILSARDISIHTKKVDS